MAKATEKAAAKRGKAQTAEIAPAASATDALMQAAMKKQEVAKAIAISRAADFTGKGRAGSPLLGGSDGEAGRGGGQKKYDQVAVMVSPNSPPPRLVRSASQDALIDPPHKGEGRAPALAGREASGPGVRIAVLPPAERISLRAPEASVAALSKALGLALSTKPKTSAISNDRTALWLGPDEWLIIDDAGNDPLMDCGKAKTLHSAVGISHRNVAMAVTGPACEATLSAGCPQDLSLAIFPVGACSRTVLGKSEIVLLRTAEDAFRVECWRSFSDYVFAFLADAAKDSA